MRNQQIRLDKPGNTWDDGLFLGNGRLGASILGQVEEEVIPMNEETIWYGGPLNRNNPDGRAHIEEIRKLLQEGETEKAAFLAKTAMFSTPKYQNPYLPAGNLRICHVGLHGEVTGYRRTLDMTRALVEVEYEIGGVPCKREYFVSRKRNVFAVRITTGKPFSVAANLNRRPYEEYTGKLDDKTTGIWGRCGENGVCYFGGLHIKAEGAGTMGDYAAAEGVQVVELFASFGTDFGGQKNFREDCIHRVQGAGEIGFEALFAEHLADWTSLYNRVEFSLGQSESDVETPARLQALRDGGDEQALVESIFHYGRYLLISSSTDCTMPANLQGIWNGTFTPPWESKYTININTEMNYWAAEICNLPECHLPLFQQVERMLPRGQETAKILYGCEGFVAHHNTNLWADTAVEGILESSPIWPMGGAWLSLHFFEHFLFTNDRKFLEERALPVLEESVLFFTQYLTEGSGNTLISGPSLSPENRYVSRKGAVGALCMAPTMDSQILRELFRDYLRTSQILGRKSALTEQAEVVLSRLPKTEVGTDGRIKEWQEEYVEVEPGHRHISHLFGLYPGSQITEEDSALFEGAKKTLRQRLENGGGHTGWSCTWIICFYARLKEKQLAQTYLKKLLTNSMQGNLLDSHPPFQIDGNLGVTAAIAEMLCQSHNEYYELLPTLPESWKDGKLTGIRLRGNVGLDLYWKNGSLERAVFTAKETGTREVRYGGKSRWITLEAEVPLTITGNF